MTGGVTPLYLHGVPTSSDDWVPFLERTGGVAPDLPGFGRSGKPGYLTYTMEEYDRFLERFLDERGLERVSLVVHDWGAVGLLIAQRLPERIARVVIINAVPLLPGYRWHRTARIWRTPLLGEFSMGMTFRFTLRQLTRESNATPGPLPEQWIDSTMAHFDQGTQRAILRLYRSSPPGEARRGGRSPRRAGRAGARPLGHARPLHPRALRARLRCRAAARGARGVPRRGALGLARPARHDRPRGRLPERRVSAQARAAPAARSDRLASLRRPPAWTLTALIAVVYLIVAPQSPDLAAASYRSHLFSQLGFTVWDNSWYGGHHLPAYSVLAPRSAPRSARRCSRRCR